MALQAWQTCNRHTIRDGCQAPLRPRHAPLDTPHLRRVHRPVTSYYTPPTATLSTAPGTSATTAAPLRSLHPPSDPRTSGYLQVSPTHSIYYETHGNPSGVPAVFLHGGPGAGCYANHARFFDLSRYNVVLLDQRGCGRSEPRGCLSDNHTDALVSDLELLRNHLRLGPWVVLGGSWGTTLALAYAQHYPGRVLGMILRGVCLMRPSEVDWLFRTGASVLRPLGWQHFMSGLAPVEQADPLAGYYSRFLSPRADQRDAAVRSWSQWEMSVGTVNNSTDTLVWDGAAWSQQPRTAAGPPPDPPAQARPPPQHTAAMQAPPQRRGTLQPGQGGHSSPPLHSNDQLSAVATPPAGASSYSHGPFTPALAWHSQWQSSVQQQEQLQQLLQAGLQHAGSKGMSQGTTQALLTSHYSMHGAFLLEEPLLAHMHHINGRQFPCIAVQGQQDLICPPGTAFDLHQAWPDMELRLVPGAGHSMYDPAITHELVCATDRMLQLL